MNEWIYLIISKLIEWGIPFGLGLLVRKRVARFLVKSKKWLLNDIVPINIMSVRSYSPTEINEFSHELYEDVKTRIPNIRLLELFSNGMRLAVPIFGNLRIGLDKIFTEENMEQGDEEKVESIKVTLNPESPVRLGIREVHLLNDFAQYTEILFSAVEKFFVKKRQITQNYTLLEIPRVGYFKEEKAFEFEDEILGASVHATPSKITIVVAASTQISKAAQKYILV